MAALQLRAHDAGSFVVFPAIGESGTHRWVARGSNRFSSGSRATTQQALVPLLIRVQR